MRQEYSNNCKIKLALHCIHVKLKCVVLRETNGATANSTRSNKDCDNNKDNDNNDFDHSEPVFEFTINSNTQEVDCNNNDQENGRPGSIRQNFFPKFDNCSSSSEFSSNCNRLYRVCLVGYVKIKSQ